METKQGDKNWKRDEREWRHSAEQLTAVTFIYYQKLGRRLPWRICVHRP